MHEEKLFIFSHKKGNIEYYKPNPKLDIFIESINLETGEISKKKILEYTYHYNLEMYKIEDPKVRFEPFWVSSDHSLICRVDKERLEKVSPIDVLKDTEKYELVQKVNNEINYIPCNELSIQYDPNITEAADFTVEDNFTFCTHDGVFVQDTCAVYRPVSEKAIKECEEKMWTINNIFSAANMEVQYVAEQSIVYGIWKLTASEMGRRVFEQSLGLEPGSITKQVSSKDLKRIINNECLKGNVSILDKVKTLGFATIITSPETLSILDLQPIDKSDVEITGDREKDSNTMQIIQERVKSTFSKADIINSGARANWDQIRQMIALRGYVSDFFGNIVNVPVTKSYAEGLSPEEYFISCYGVRKGILDVAENTAKSGYLTRKLIYATISCLLDPNLEDCGTDFCVSVDVKDKDIAKALIGRYYYPDDESNELLCVEDPDEIVGKTIFLRTPMLCESKKICKTCYGKLAEFHKSPFIGVIASQTIGERSTQLVLRTFHTSGVAQGKKLDKQEDIVSTIKTVESLDKTYSVSSVLEAYEDTVNLWRLFKDYGYLHLVHFEVITAQRLWAELETKFVRYRTHTQELEEYEEYDSQGRLISAKYDLKMMSLKEIPSLESWFLGMIFQDVRSNFIKGLLYPSKKTTILEKIVLGNIT